MSWHHPHSVTLGLIVGLVLSQHLLLVAGACLAVGVVLGRSWAGLVRLGAAVVDRVRAGVHEPEPQPYDRELDEPCECGAHVKAVPCYFPTRATLDREARQGISRAHPAFDPWSRRV